PQRPGPGRQRYLRHRGGLRHLRPAGHPAGRPYPPDQDGGDDFPMKLEGAIFDLDGTLTDSMHIWNEAPKALVRQFGGEPPEDLAEDIKEMGRREASEYMVARFSLPCTPEQVMDGVNDLVTDEYRDKVPM